MPYNILKLSQIIFKQKNNKFLSFFLRAFSSASGFLLLTYQYSLANDVKLFFHYFTVVSLSTYLLDLGYSEKVTKFLTCIDVRFLRKNFITFIILSLTCAILLGFGVIKNNYIGWILVSIIYTPLQATFDVVYRIYLKSNGFVEFCIFQIVQPLLILSVLWFVPNNYIDKLWIIYLILCTVIPLFFIFIMSKWVDINVRVCKDQSNHFSNVDLNALLLKITPPIIYFLLTQLVKTNIFSSQDGLLESIRVSFFLFGFVLLLSYSGKNIINYNFYTILLVFFILSSLILMLLLISKFMIFSTKIYMTFDIIIMISVSSLLFSGYIYVYNKWLIK